MPTIGSDARTKRTQKRKAIEYTIIIEKTGNGYSAYVPDLPGCVAAADAREEVGNSIREAVTHHVALFREHGKPVPELEATTGLVEV